MRKRQKFVLSAFLLAVGLTVVSNFSLELRYLLTIGLVVVTWVMVVWCLADGLNRTEWFVVPIPATMLTLGFGLFYILLPSHWVARTLIMLVFIVCQYACILAANIFSVAAIRTIALLRTAHVVGTFIMLLTAFMLFNTIGSFRLGTGWTGFWVFILIFF